MSLDVTWLTLDGAGAGPADGDVVRVPGALPGDRVRFTEERRRGRTVHASLDAIEVPSPHRRVPTCPWDARCGGCDLSAFAPEARREALAAAVAQALRLPEPPEVVPSPRPTGHRARIKLALRDGRVGYSAEHSHDLVEIGTCAAARPEVAAAIAPLRAVDTTGLSEVDLRSDGSRVVYAFRSDGPVSRATRDGLAALGDVALDGRRLHGDPVLWLDVGGVRLRASPGAFYQVNLEANARLVAHVVALAAGSERAVDLYAGIGNLTLALIRAGIPTVAVEREGQATADLLAAAPHNAVTPPKVVTADVARFDPSREAFDLAVLDPPRAGAPGVLARVVRNRPRTLVYVSCNAVTLVRDLREATDAGYAVTSVRCFDLFPDTHHVEVVVGLSRNR